MHLHFRPLLLVAALGLLGHASRAQSLATTPATRPETAAAPNAPYVVDHWGTEEGLPQNSVMALAQATNGYLWVGTSGGLARFDGVRFVVFNRTTVPALPDDRVVRLAASHTGDLWLLTLEGGVTRWRADGTTTAYTRRDGLPDGPVSSVVETRARDLFVGTSAGLFRFDGRRFARLPGLPVGGAGTVFEDTDGTLWVGVGTRLLHLGAPSTSYRVLGAYDVSGVNTIGRGGDGVLWVGTRERGLLRAVGGGFAEVPLPPTTEPRAVEGVHALAVDAQGAVWAATSAGLLHVENGRIRRLGPADGLSSAVVRSVYADAEGSVWIGTDNAGLDRLTVAPFQVYGAAQGLGEDVAFSITEDRAGHQWVVTNCGGLSEIADGVVRRTYKEDDAFARCFASVLEDRAGRLWVGSYGGGLYVRGSGGRFQPYEGPQVGSVVLALYEDRAGALWIGTIDGGLGRLKDGRLTRFGTAQGLPSLWVRGILEDRSGTLWVATNAGLARMRGGRFTTLTTADGLSSNDLRALYEDADGTLWVGTYGAGLNRIRDGAVRAFTTADGLPENVVSAILEDPYGHFWMSGNRGITRVSRAALNALAADGPRSTLNARLFGREAGLKLAETNGGFQPAAWKGADGRLWFPTFSGAAVVDPAAIGLDRAAPPVLVEQVRAGAQVWPRSAPLRLPLGERRFEVAYTSLRLSSAPRIQFRYRLAGLDTAWVQAGATRTATFTNVPPGHYTFEVQASNAWSVWSASATREIVVPPFATETGWFRGGLLLALLAAGWGGVDLRLRRLRERAGRLEAAVSDRTRELTTEKASAEQAWRDAEEQRGIAEGNWATVEAQATALKSLDAAKSRFFANLSHEFRTPLTLIIGPVESAAETLRSGGHAADADDLATALSSAQRLQRLIDQLLDLARLEGQALPFEPREGDLVAFTREIVRGFAPLAEARGLTLAFEAPGAPVHVRFDVDALEKVVFNLVANAVKFTREGGRIAVRVGTQPGTDGAQALVSVRDSGVGVAPEMLPLLFDRFFQASPHHARSGAGIGLSLTKELVELHGGRIEVESKVGFGSTFTVLLPGIDGAASALHAPVLLEDVLAAPPPPRAPATDEAPTASRDEAMADEESPGARATVLLVEDNDEVRAFTRRHLAALYHVREARDGADGLRMAFEQPPDVVVTDVMMPEMDGFALCAALKADARTALVPVLMLSARSTAENRVSGLETGADDYLVKPFVARELLARVENLLRSRQQLQAAYGRTVTFAPTGVVLASADEAFLDRVRAAVEARLDDAEFDVTALADAVGVSQSGLNRRLKALTGQPPVQFVRTTRLLRAADMLQQRAGTVAEVAFASGFNNLSYFARCFRTQFGVAPSDYAALDERVAE